VIQVIEDHNYIDPFLISGNSFSIYRKFRIWDVSFRILSIWDLGLWISDFN